VHNQERGLAFAKISDGVSTEVLLQCGCDGAPAKFLKAAPLTNGASVAAGD